MSDKPLFDFTKKYTKRSIAEFLLKNGVNESLYKHRTLDTPEQVEQEVVYMCKEKLFQLEHLAKLYNSSIIFGGNGNYDRWAKAECDTAYALVRQYLTDEVVHPALGVSSVELNDVYIPTYRDVLYNDRSVQWWILLSDFRKPLDPILDKLKAVYKDYETSVIGCHIGTKEEAKEFFELLKPLYIEYVNTLKSDAKFMQFLEEKKEKDLESKQ
jgi:hypothetical protein